MFVKLVSLALCLTSTLAAYHGPLAGGLPADLYPAGVSPQACPNFPNCANPAVAANPGQAANQAWGQPAWNNQPKPAWTQQQNQWNGNNQQWSSGDQWNGNQNALDRGEYTGDGDYHGEGLAEALAPGYENSGGWNNWNNGGNQQYAQPAPNWNQGYQGGPKPAQIPAGVDPGSCPNYPFCH
ncbi:uncharacterized protein LOC115884945 [Sitophilus oryzae]|uniref:Uncharacterized protein LOC115884945 n=1 Tax=Sitophilus oryzae TaxID=7048 RepID=A0A6J2Y8I6_SITOR|nr:uncharacterized protein LOC115884945 [Sitophilus oryzae]